MDLLITFDLTLKIFKELSLKDVNTTSSFLIIPISKWIIFFLRIFFVNKIPFFKSNTLQLFMASPLFSSFGNSVLKRMRIFSADMTRFASKYEASTTMAKTNASMMRSMV